MQSCAWTNGQNRQVGPPSQSSQAAAQFTHSTMRNQQTRTANMSYQYRTANTGVRPPQSDNFSYGNGAYSNRQPSNWQTSAVPHQTVSSQQPAGRNGYLLNMTKTGNQHHSSTNTQSGNPGQNHSSTNTQSGNPGLLATYGFQQDFHQNSAQNTSTESPLNLLKGNTTYPQQNMSAYWNELVRVHGKQSIRIQDGKIVSDFQHHGDQNSLFYNVNGESTKPVSAYTTTGTSTSHEEQVYAGTSVPAAPHNRQTAHNHNHRQNGTQHGFSPSIPPPSFRMAISQSFRNNSITTNSSSGGQNLHISSTSQTTQQCSTNNNGRETNSSINSNLCTKQYEIAMIARIADDLRKSFTAGSDSRSAVYTSSPYGGKFVSEARRRESNQNVQPVTSTVTGGYTSNASQSLPLNSGQFLPKTSRSVMSTQQSVDVLSQQNSVPNVFYVTATGSGSGNESKAANAFFSKKKVGSSNDASQLMQLLKNISPQTNETQSSVANGREMLEMLSSVKSNDSSIHSSPGRTRAVAVVQPLSHECCQVAHKHTCSDMTSQSSEGTETDESSSNPEKLFISPKNRSYPYLENPNQKRPNKSAIRHSEASNDGAFVSSPDSAMPQDLLQKQLCSDGTGSKLAFNMQVDQCVSQPAKQSVTSEVPVSQSGSDKDKNEMQTDPRGIFELSLVPTTPWTPVTLTKLIQDAEKAQMELKDFTKFDSAGNLLFKLFTMFWNGSVKTFLCELKTIRNRILDAEKFCREHVTPDSVILSQVKCQFGKQIKSCHVLKDNEVYSELPYKSSWLNVNEQLDDIDKEFDFPQSLKRRFHMLESDSQPDQVEKDNGTLVQIESEMSNKIELEPSEEIQDSIVETTSTETASPNELESADSSDPYDKIEIHVFPPEEARVIFEQIQSKLQQNMDMDSQPERVTNGSVEGELPKVIDATLSNTKQENEPVCPIEEICCIARLAEIIWGPNKALSKCQCNQRHEDITENVLHKEGMAVQKKDELCAMRSNNNFHSAAEEASQAKARDNVGNPVMTLCCPEQSNDLSHTNDLTEGDGKLHSYSSKEPKNISQISISSCQSSTIHLSESADDLSSSENEIPNQIPDFENDSERAQVKLPESSHSGDSDKKENKELSRCDTATQSDPEVDCVQNQLKSAGSMQSCTLVNSDKAASQMSDLEENFGRAQLTSTHVAGSSLETEEKQTEISATGALQTTRSGRHETVQRKRKKSHDMFFPIFRESKKCKSLADGDSRPVLEGTLKCGKVFVPATDSELSASNVRTAELVLFGSTPQDNCVLVGGRKRHFSSPESVSDAASSVPKVLTVKLGPSRRNSSDTVPTGECSVKQWLYEKWRRSIPPSQMRHRSKLKIQKHTIASLSGPKKAGTVRPANTEELPGSSEMRKCLSLTKRRYLSNELKRQEEMKRHTVTLNQPADQERSKAENGRQAVMPLPNNDVLKFSVLPSTFNFNDGPNGRKDTSGPTPDKPDLAEGHDESQNKTSTKARGIWLPNPEKKYRPLFKTCNVFHEFQKKYNKKTQPSMDE